MVEQPFLLCLLDSVKKLRARKETNRSLSLIINPSDDRRSSDILLFAGHLLFLLCLVPLSGSFMADLHGTATADTDPEEITTFLSHFLNNSSSSSSSSCIPFESKCVFPFSSGSNTEFKSVAALMSDRLGTQNGVDPSREISCISEKNPVAADIPPSSAVRPRTSSKRSRAAEAHNISEKRRRSRINEKLKALQTLIPNSNKTDKASMLDKAIEYLQQLQLRVQMLAMRNRTSLGNPYMSEPLNLSQIPPKGVWHDGGTSTFSSCEASMVNSVFNNPKSNDLISAPPATMTVHKL